MWRHSGARHPAHLHRALLAFVAVAVATAWPAARAADVDRLVAAELEAQRIPGASIAVVRNGQVIHARGYGLANVELKIPSTAESVFQIGSVSKQFIATGIMLLVQDGKVALDDPVNQHLDNPPALWASIRIRHLLSHTSGLVREAPGFTFARPLSDADVIASAHATPLRFAPGERWEYCNLGYFMLADIIRKVSGSPWPDFLRDRVFRPSQMQATRTTTAAEIVPNRANGYVRRDGALQNADTLVVVRPSGAFLSSVTDLAKWDAMLYTDSPLKRATVEQMATPVIETTNTVDGTLPYSYGFGWQVATLNGHRIVSHGGSLTGFRSMMMRFPDDRLTIIVLTNLAQANPDLIARKIAAIYLPSLSGTAARRD
jgi:CubicO group peptidase (beta-lactamase class C family)